MGLETSQNAALLLSLTLLLACQPTSGPSFTVDDDDTTTTTVIGDDDDDDGDDDDDTTTPDWQDGDHAIVLSATLPTALDCGDLFEARVTMQNLGTTTWSFEEGYKLGGVDDQDPFYGPDVRVYLPEGTTVAPGESHEFVFQMQANVAAGVHLTDWQMVHELVNWFGETALSNTDVTCDAPPARTGRVSLSDHSLLDDQGTFNALGTTMMWAAWAYKNDQAKLQANLQFLQQNGFHYIRALGVVGDPVNPDYWDGREIDEQWADYDAVIAGLTDMAYDQYGLRVEWTLIGDGQLTVPTDQERYDLVDRFLAMSVGREHKILHFEIANEYWSNGFSGDDGLQQLRDLTLYMNDRTDILVAASAPQGFLCEGAEDVYNGGIADIATIHFERRNTLVDGAWRPVRQPWEHEYCVDVPVGSNNEPIGPGSSVYSESDPIKLVAGAVMTYTSNLPMYVFHTGSGVRGDTEIYDEPGVDAFRHLQDFVPGDLASWTRKNAHWGDAPFQVYAEDAAGLHADLMWPDLNGPLSGVVRAYGDVSGDSFFVVPMGILDHVVMEPRRDMSFDVIDPMTGLIVDSKVLVAGEQFELTGYEVLVLSGVYL